MTYVDVDFSSSVRPRLDLQLSPAGAPSQRPKAAESGQAPQCLQSCGPGSLAHCSAGVPDAVPIGVQDGQIHLLPQLSPAHSGICGLVDWVLGETWP